MNDMTRRRFLEVATTGMAVTLAGCGSSSTQKTSGNWSFTDDRGVTVSLKAQPKQVVAYDLAAAALMNIGVKCAGIFASLPLADNPQLSGLNLSGVATVGSSYGKLNLETLASLRPDIIVTIFDPRLAGPVIGFPDMATQMKAEQLAPIVAINSIKDVTGVIDRFEQLGRSLGIDLKGRTVASAHQQFESASNEVRAATGAKPGLKAVAVSANQGIGFSFTRPDANPTLRFYESLGLNLVKPTSTPGDINKNYNLFFYERDSFELAGKYPADLILYNDMPNAESLTELAAVPTWRALPAVKAGQLLPWRVLDPFSDAVLGQDLGKLAKAVQSAKIVT